MNYLDHIPSVGITKEEWTNWMKNNNRNLTDPYVHRHMMGNAKGQSEYEIRAKIPRGTNKKEKTNA